jgi:cytochrome c peroxidase
MSHFPRVLAAAAASAMLLAPAADAVSGGIGPTTVPAATSADSAWKLPAVAPMPAGNQGNAARVQLGKALFFDPRLSGNGASSCATCHNPSLGWSDGQKTAVGFGGAILGRATPTIVNTAFNTQFMWDGRKKSLEDQALGPMKAPEEMNTNFPQVIERLGSLPGYRAMFERAYPGEPIGEETIAKALAAFERTVISRDSALDRWVAGDRKALTPEQWRGYQVFTDRSKGNCATCHSGPNFTDNGFHNIGLKAASGAPDLGRFNERKVASMRAPSRHRRCATSS